VADGLTAQQRYFFDVNGYLVLDGVLPQRDVEYLDAIVAAQRMTPPGQSIDSQRFGDEFLRWDAGFRDLLDHAAVLPLLRDLLGDHLRVDSSAEVVRPANGRSYARDAPTKTANQRSVWLDPDTVQMIEALRDVRADASDFMFSEVDGPPMPDRIGWWWRRARELSGIDSKWRLHDLRHWTATMGIASGHDVRTVAGRIGHSNAAMTLRVYAHGVEQADHALGQTLGDALRSATS